MTVQDAIAQITSSMQAQGKLSLASALDSVIGVAVANNSDLQQMLNKLLGQTGVLSADDEAAVQLLLQKKQQELAQRRKIRVKNFLIIGGTLILLTIGVYLAVRKHKK